MMCSLVEFIFIIIIRLERKDYDLWLSAALRLFYLLYRPENKIDKLLV